MTDELRDIPGFPDYAVTRDGRVWSKRKSIWLRPGIASHGYPTVSLYGQTKCLHEIVLIAWVAERPIGVYCRHLDGNKQNNKVENLAWGTASENSYDAVRHGTAPGLKKGLKRAKPEPGTSKLSREEVLLIFHVYHDGAYNQNELADMFNVDQSQISNIVRQKYWKHITTFPFV